MVLRLRRCRDAQDYARAAHQYPGEFFMNGLPSVWRCNPLPSNEQGELVSFTRNEAGWEWMSFAARRLHSGSDLELATRGEEMALVILGGQCIADWGAGPTFIGKRASVFDGFPHAIYLPPGCSLKMKAETVCEFAECRVPSRAAFAPVLITPDRVASCLRGGENASRQIVNVIPPEFPADKLVAIEVYTPGGNWSSYPPHKHDVDKPPFEVDLDEIYYYRIKHPQGYALQNLYTTDARRKSDCVVKVHDGDAVLVREGFHPVVAGPGYDTYYLNFLAGTLRGLAVTEDPNHVWLRDTWKMQDARLPLVGL
jgi:5-deoxy-glucuronate isomerase